MHAAALLLALAAASPSAPAAAPLALTVGSTPTVVTGAVRGKDVVRYTFAPPAQGTLFVALQPIHGATPRALLKTAAGRARRDRNGQLWSRSPAAEPLTLEVRARAVDAPGIYQLRIAFDVDRPREERHHTRALRPGDVVRLPRDGQVIERVIVDGIAADHGDSGADVLVTIPAFARSGTIALHVDGGPVDVRTLPFIGPEPVRTLPPDTACAGTAPVRGCITVTLAPVVGSAWLREIARIVDADLVAHDEKTSTAVVKLRLASTESFAVATLTAMPGVRAARAGTR